MGFAGNQAPRPWLERPLKAVHSVREGNSTQSMRAWGMLGKSVGMFDPKRQQPEQHLRLHSDERTIELVTRQALQHPQSAANESEPWKAPLGRPGNPPTRGGSDLGSAILGSVSRFPQRPPCGQPSRPHACCTLGRMPKRRSQIVMSDSEQREFLERGRTLQLATVGPGGFPHLSAMWYAVVDGKICFNTYATSQKGLNMDRDARVTCMVESGTEYAQLQGLVVQGRVEVIESPDQVRAFGAEMAKRYPTPEAPARPLASTERGEVALATKRKLYAVVPEKVYSWDHTKLPAGVH